MKGLSLTIRLAGVKLDTLKAMAKAAGLDPEEALFDLFDLGLTGFFQPKEAGAAAEHLRGRYDALEKIRAEELRHAQELRRLKQQLKA